jgi:hypothetical protein
MICNQVNARAAKVNLKDGFRAVPESRKDLVALYNRVVSKVSAMSADERFETMVRAGIYTKGGKLSKKYGG